MVCLDNSRVILNLNVPPESDYVHANTVRYEGLDQSYIATQGPLDSTIPDFWRMVHQESATSVLMLCKWVEEGKNKCSQYFPDANTYKNYGSMFVNNKRTEIGEDKLLIHTIEVLPDGCSNSTIIKLFQMNDWPDRGLNFIETCRKQITFLGVPEKPRAILRLLRAIPPGMCVIHCSAGIGRTGTVILIDAIISRLLKGRIARVKEMFQTLRNQRASAVRKFFYFICSKSIYLVVETEAQYIMIHTCVLEYIRVCFIFFIRCDFLFFRPRCQQNIGIVFRNSWMKSENQI